MRTISKWQEKYLYFIVSKLYNQQMKYHFIILALIAFVYIQGQTIILTPVLPATAFENEFYQVRFRVRNLIGARFEFKNVPQFFTASSQGLLSGVPTKQGLYAIEVVYFNDTYKDSKQVMIDVRRGTKLTNYNSGSETQQSLSIKNQLKPKEQYLFTYNQNDELDIQVNITNGLAPYRFMPIYIPTELQFDNKTGTISGSFHHYGDYLIGIKVKDNKDNEMQVLIKISIVIQNTTAPKFIFYQRSILQIQFQIQQSASNSTNALPAVSTGADNKHETTIKGGSINLSPNDVSKTVPQTPQTNTQPSSQTQPSHTNNRQSSTTTTINQQSQPVIPQQIAKSAQTDKKIQQIVSTQNLINKNITTDANLQKIQKQKDQLNNKLQKSKDELKFCYDNVQTFRKTVQNLLNTYNQQFAKVDGLKNQLQQLKTKSQRSSIDLTEKIDKLKRYEIEKNLAEKQFNRSTLSYDNVNFAYNGSVENIRQNNKSIEATQNDIESYKRDLDNSYKALDEAMTLNTRLNDQRTRINEQIKKGMGVFSKIKSNQGSFGGCQSYKFYQKSVGVGQVRKVMDKLYLLTNNQFINYGDCTEHQKALPGDIIQWSGYLMNGSVSALTIKKLK